MIGKGIDIGLLILLAPKGARFYIEVTGL